MTVMFTGIIEELGTVTGMEHLPDAARIQIAGPRVSEDAALGDSIAVNGVCLTVTHLADGQFTADVMAETLRRSTLATLAIGDPVNLERPVSLSSRLGGHMVQGHVDGVGHIRARQPREHWDVVTISMPSDLSRYVVEKGSIAVDGVSLTVVDVSEADASDAWFAVSLIPETLSRTTLGARAVGAAVNLEVDVIAKHVERLMAGRV